jgi:hypothetical protein
MYEAWFEHFFFGALGGLVAFLVLHGLLSLKLFRLQVELSTLRNALLSVKNREKAETRWTRRDEMEQQLLSGQASKNVHQERFANDPLNFG